MHSCLYVDTVIALLGAYQPNPYEAHLQLNSSSRQSWTSSWSIPRGACWSELHTYSQINHNLLHNFMQLVPNTVFLTGFKIRVRKKGLIIPSNHTMIPPPIPRYNVAGIVLLAKLGNKLKLEWQVHARAWD